MTSWFFVAESDE